MKALQRTESFIQELEVLGLDFDKKNIPANCEGQLREVLATVRPRNSWECQSLLRIARTFQCALYTVSTGKNWGFGTSTPTADHCLLMDLSRMNEIVEYSEEYGTVTLQPGVTQIQLASFLKEAGDCFFVDVTGSGEETSVLGNAVERGVGYQSLRHDTVVSFKVLLANGTIVHTGYSRFANSKLGRCLPSGLGASLKDIFTQSNFGIVLEATFKLQKKNEYHCVFSYSLENDRELLQNSQLVKELFDEQMITCIPKLADRRRCEVLFCSNYFEKEKKRGRPVTREECLKVFDKLWGNKKWTFLASLSGPRKVVEAKLEYLQKKLEAFKGFRVVDEKSLKEIPVTSIA